MPSFSSHNRRTGAIIAKRNKRATEQASKLTSMLKEWQAMVLADTAASGSHKAIFAEVQQQMPLQVLLATITLV